MAFRDENDIRRSLEFRSWVKQQREERGLTYEDCTRNVNSQLDVTEHLAKDAWRMREQRPTKIATVTRKVCRQVAAGLHINPDIVFMQAGYMPDDMHLQKIIRRAVEAELRKNSSEVLSV